MANRQSRGGGKLQIPEPRAMPRRRAEPEPAPGSIPDLPDTPRSLRLQDPWPRPLSAGGALQMHRAREYQRKGYAGSEAEKKDLELQKALQKRKR